MRTYPFEATNGVNRGRFMVGILDEEWDWPSRADPAERYLVNRWQWGTRHMWVMDLVTGEGAWFSHGGSARSDLNAKRIHVCLLFEPFLEWLYRQPRDRIPDLAGQVVELPDAPCGLYGYRRQGQGSASDAGATAMPGHERKPEPPQRNAIEVGRLTTSQLPDPACGTNP